MALRAVLFDAAGTLLRVRGSVGEVYARVAAAHGVNVVAEDIERQFRTVFPRMPPLCFPGMPENQLTRCEYEWWQDLVRTVFLATHFADFDAFFRELFDHFAQPDSWELFPDVMPALVELRSRGLQLAIISNFDARLFPICTGLGIADKFDEIVVSSRAGFAKPDPRIFAVALERLGVSATETLHIGDSEREDVAGAQAAGLHAVRVDRSHTKGVAPNTIYDLRELVLPSPQTLNR